MVACVRVTITKIIDTFVDRCIVVSSPDPIYAKTGLHHRCKSILHIHLFCSPESCLLLRILGLGTRLSYSLVPRPIFSQLLLDNIPLLEGLVKCCSTRA